MKAKRIFLALAILFVASILVSSCHNNVPCPVYADNDNAEEIVQPV
ncbi:MAG: hypothetical protein PHD06_08095 [Bacteroidales bacterium]|jgi:hypothetical protein|nr:hypothetical protein [Bacteroidales bacterium]MDD4385127.1 hypothetical protein [Bacteroidales bacterium]MDY0197713.1 hypothetical protein [Tenuifilaceae bacterium]